ncbi:hypothetical protein ABL78_4481 [Leptomonas seymouri]|uniref:Uncharacterized protein n=1 Tax=Leptomonas seymouri TaxID=5684 RepID=A0A0N1I3G3_LEPSE|nr:hypothetical protein ABL78_4481 [Leptomonas seymouri]|eukprot:KPI86450.1 hypothetical protein ABL78_4481 [Leptomonas seymouri]
MRRNMNASPPHLPLLGGHKGLSLRKPTPKVTSPFGPTSLNPSPRIEPARASNSAERPYVDAGYDNDDIPHAQQQAHFLGSRRSTSTPSTPQQQAPSPLRPGPPPPSDPASQSWKDQVKNELLSREARPSDSAPAPSDRHSSALALASAARRRDTSSGSDRAEDSKEAPQGSADVVGQVSPSRFSSLPTALSSTSAFTAAASHAIPIIGVPKSPDSAASSLATDTPRSILRHPGRRRDTPPPRSDRRRISFADLSPLRDDGRNNSPDGAREPRESLSGEEDDDDYEFSEPLLRYKTDTPPTSAPSARAHDVGDGQSTRVDPAATDSWAHRERSPDARRGGSQERLSSSTSPQPVNAWRSPTRSPPRDVDEVRPYYAARTAVVASAPPPPEEENDIITLDTASPPRAQQKQQQQRHQAAFSGPSPQPRRSPDRAGRAAANSAAGNSGPTVRDEDVLTQPHYQSHCSSQRSASGPAAVGAPAGRRPLSRQRWPSDAYADEPPTEVSTTQHGSWRSGGASGHRESLDPEDDMGSSDTRSSDTSQDDYSSDEHSDGEPSFHYESPVKESLSRRSSSNRSVGASVDCPRTQSPKAASSPSSPHRGGGSVRGRSWSPNQSQPRSPSGRLPERRMSTGSSEGREGSVMSSVHKNRSSSDSRERPIPPTPSSFTEDLENKMRQRHRLSHEDSTVPLSNQQMLLPFPGDNKRMKHDEEPVPEVVPREGSSSGSHGRSPSTITNRSSGRSVGEETEGVAESLPLPPAEARALPCQPSKRSSSSKHRSGQGAREGEHRHIHQHREALEHALPADSLRRSSKQDAPKREGRRKAASVTGAAVSAVAAKELVKDGKGTKKEEPQVYVDPLLRERRHRHYVSRQLTPTYLDERAPSMEGVVPLRQDNGGMHTSAPPPHEQQSARLVSSGNRDQRGGAFEPVSLRDIMARHNTPDAKGRRTSPLSKRYSQAASIEPSSGHVDAEGERRLTERQILHEPRVTDRANVHLARTSSTAGVSSEKGDEEARSESSKLSSDGVLAEDLVWDASTPSSRAGSASPPVSPGSSSASRITAAGGHKVFRKKLVMVVRRRKSGAPPSEDDAVVKMSLVPYVEGSPAVKHAVEHQVALRQERLASESRSVEKGEGARRSGGSAIGAVSTLTAGGAPLLERFIEHILPGRKSSVRSRHSSRSTHIHEERAVERGDDGDGGKTAGGEEEITEEDRLHFRRALSTLSSRSASRRSSVAPSAHSRHSPSRGALSASSPSTPLEEEQHQARSHIRSAGPNTDKMASRKSSVSAIEHRLTPQKWNSYAPSSASAQHHAPKPELLIAVEAEKNAMHSEARRQDESTMTHMRHCHHHSHSSAHRGSMQTSSKQKRRHRAGSTTESVGASSHRSCSAEQSHHGKHPKSQQVGPTPPPSLPDAPYRPTQNDEYYFGAGLGNEVAQLKQESISQRIGITPVAMQLLPRILLEADKGSRGQRRSADGEGVAAWSASESEHEVAQDAEEYTARSRGKYQRQQPLKTSATQTDRFALTNMKVRAESGMPLMVATPVLRPPVGVESVASAAISALDANCIGDSLVATTGYSVSASQLQRPRGATHANEVASAGGDAAALAQAVAPVLEEGDWESPASYVKRQTVPLSKVSAHRAVANVATAVHIANSPMLAAYAPIHAATSTFPPASDPPAFGRQRYPSPTSYPSQVAAPSSYNGTYGAFPQPAETSHAGVPFFVPPLTVDNVSHLTQDWQSTLRERSSKAKQNAMEQFLIASAEAGAAAALNSSNTQAAAPGMEYNGSKAAYASDAAPATACGSSAIIGAGAPSDWGGPRHWPTALQPGLPADEYFGQSQYQQQPRAPAVIINTAPLVVQASPPFILPQPFLQAGPKARQGAARVGAAVSAPQQARRAPSPAAGARQKSSVPPGSTTPAVKVTKALKDTPASKPAAGAAPKGKLLSRSSSTPQADVFDLVEGSDAEENSRSISSDRDTVESVDAVEPLAQPLYCAARSLTPPTSAALASEQSPPHPRAQHHHHLHSPHDSTAILSPAADPAESKRSKRHKHTKPSHRSTASTSAIATTPRDGHSSAKPAFSGFTIAEVETETPKPKGAAGARHARHTTVAQAEHHKRGRSAGASSAASNRQEKSRKEEKNKKKADAHHRGKDRKEEGALGKRKSSQDQRHRRRTTHTTSTSPPSSVVSHEVPFSTSDVCDLSLYKFNVDDDSDVDSDMATSIEFQLSRLLLQREKDMSRALTSLQRKQERAEGKRKKAEKERKEEEKVKSHHRHHRSASVGSNSSVNSSKGKTRHPSKDEKRKKGKEHRRDRSPSAATKHSKRDDKHKSKHHRSKSSKQVPTLLPLPPAQAHAAWAGDDSPPQGHAELPFGESRYNTSPYESIGASRFGSASSYPYRWRDYPSRASLHTAENERERPLSPAQSYLRSYSNGLDSNYNVDTFTSRYGAASTHSGQHWGINGEGEGVPRFRYTRHRPYVPSPVSRWADTPRRFYEDDDAWTSPMSAPAYTADDRKSSRAARPSTHWADYVREAGLNGRTSSREAQSGAPTASRYSPPSSASPRYTSYGQRRQSSRGEAASRSAGTERRHPQASPSTPSSYKPSYTSRTGDDYDIDDIPKKSYFNDDAADAYSSPGFHRSTSTEMPRSSHRRQGRGAAAATETEADDILVSTPLRDSDGDRDSAYDYWEGRVRKQAHPWRGAPPPPPPPRDSLNGSTRAPSSSDQAFVQKVGETQGGAFYTSNALPIVREHSVTDAPSAHDFAEGVREIISALQRYKEHA